MDEYGEFIHDDDDDDAGDELGQHSYDTDDARPNCPA